MAVALSMLLAGSCVQETLEKVTPELEGCMGVYFVEGQTNAKDHTLEKGKDKSSLEFKVRRINSQEAVEVPYEYEVYKVVQNMAPGDTAYTEVPVYDDSKFKFGRLVFQKDQKEASIPVTFDNLPTGERYRCSISITDPEYAQVYGYSATSVSFTVQMFEWTKLSGKAIYREGFLSDIITLEDNYLETEVDIYERKDKKGFYRLDNIYSADFLARLIEGEEAYQEDKVALENKYKPYVISGTQIFVDASDPDKVYIPEQNIGLTSSFMGGLLYIASDVSEVYGADSNLLYGKLSEDKVITFPKNGITLGMSGYVYFSNIAGKLRIVLPGGKAEDYGIDLSQEDLAADGSRPITFKPAKDVKTVKYKIFTGKLTELGLDAKLKDVDATGISFTVAEGETEIKKNIIPAADAATGYYTLVACTYSDAGSTRREYSTIEFGYIKPGEERKVEIFMGLHTDDQYASDKPEQNYSSENSFRYWVRGKGITHAQLSYYPTAYYETYEAEIKKELKRYASVDSQVLKQLNADGLSGMLGNSFKAGTNYTFVVYAENGYHGEFFTDTVNTRGIQDPIKRSYYKIDLERYEQKPVSAYQGEWVPVSVDIFGDGQNGRIIRGNWRSREVTLSVSDNIVTATGLFPSLSTNPAIKFEFKDGLIHSMENKCAKVWVKDSTNIIPTMRFEYQYYPRTGAISSQGYFYEKFDSDTLKNRTDMFAGGFVHEDIIAFADNRTNLEFWAMSLGGYQKNSMGEEELQNIIGDAHGELILVRKGSTLLDGLEHEKSSAKEGTEILSSLSEANRIEMPQIGTLITDQKEVDTTDKLVEFKKDLRLKTIVK